MNPQSSVSSRAAALPIGGQPAAPVKFFALAGVIILTVFASVLFQWVTGPYFKPAPIGARMSFRRRH